MTRQILAAFDDAGLYVYQAFRPETVAAAVARGTFGAGFSLDRMTWIKPSFGWMLYRSGYGMKHRQQGILKIKIRQEGFLTILRQGVATTFDGRRYRSPEEWRSALDRSEVRFQWDPDRSLRLERLERRAIQIGIEGETVRRYVNEWIIGLEEVTPLAKAIRTAIDERRPLPAVPEERVYPVSDELRAILGMER